jgi:hypothetical protein
MRYEHLVQINDLTRPDLPVLGRGQLWLGLLARAERPAVFDPSIDSSRVLRRDGPQLERELLRGSRATRETVRLAVDSSIEIGIGAGTEFEGSSLRISIEEPQPQALFLRFIYQLVGPATPVDEAEQCALRQAYYYADLETVHRIRTLIPEVVES